MKKEVISELFGVQFVENKVNEHRKAHNFKKMKEEAKMYFTTGVPEKRYPEIVKDIKKYTNVDLSDPNKRNLAKRMLLGKRAADDYTPQKPYRVMMSVYTGARSWEDLEQNGTDYLKESKDSLWSIAYGDGALGEEIKVNRLPAGSRLCLSFEQGEQMSLISHANGLLEIVCCGMFTDELRGCYIRTDEIVEGKPLSGCLLDHNRRFWKPLWTSEVTYIHNMDTYDFAA